MKALRTWPLWLSLFVGCVPAADDDDDDSTPVPTTGTLAVSFRLDDEWPAEMDEPAIGRFWGSIYDADEVTGVGPDEGAVALASIDVAVVDLTGPTLTTAVLHVTEPLDARWVNILGFLDSDANADPKSPDPDEGDPVTLPNLNEFEIIAGAETPAEILFDFLNP